MRLDVSADKPDTEFPRDIGKPATRALAANGYTHYDQLTKVTTKDLLSLHGVGPNAVRILEEQLASSGLSFATAAPDGRKTADKAPRNRD